MSIKLIVIPLEVIFVIFEAVGFSRFCYKFFSGKDMTFRRVAEIEFLSLLSGVIDAYLVILISNMVFSIGRPASNTVFLLCYSLLSACCSNAGILFHLINDEQARSNEHLLKTAKLEACMADAEEYAYRTSLCLNSHFILNSLGTLSILINRNDSSASDYCDSLMECFRYHVRNAKSPLVSMQNELEFLGHYLSLMNVRFPDSIIVNISVASVNSKIPPLSLQTLVENAINHNSFSKDCPIVIDIIENDSSIEISNHINLITSDKTSSGRGLELLRLSYAAYGKSISIDTSNNKYSVLLPTID